MTIYLSLILRFPLFLLGVLLGLLRAILSEMEVLLIFVFAVLIAVLTDPLVGVAVFLGVYISLRMVSEWVGLLSSKLDLLVRVMSRHG